MLLLVAGSRASEKCNIYNFGVNGGYTCALQWWNREDLGQTVDVQFKVSDIVEEALTSFQIDYQNVSLSIMDGIGAESVDPIAKIIESALAVEPYITYAVADLLNGYGITAAELQRFSLPPALADRVNQVKMFTEYFDFSCTR